LDKYEYQLRLEQIEKLYKKRNYQDAAKIADMIDWQHAKNLDILYKVAEIYEKLERYEDCMEILYITYERAPLGRMQLYKMTEIATKMKRFDKAISLYREFVRAAPQDQSRFILKFQIYQARGSSLEDQIKILEEYKIREYQDKWAFELARLYAETGRVEDCIRECDQLILWFNEGEYVLKAMELKMQFAPLTAAQQSKYNRYKPSKQNDSFNETKIPEFRSDKYSTMNLQAELAANLEEVLQEETSVEIPKLGFTENLLEFSSEEDLEENSEIEMESFPFPEEELEEDSDIEMESFSFPEEEPEEDSDIEMESFSFPEEEPEEDSDIEMESFSFPEEEPEEDSDIEIESFSLPEEEPEKDSDIEMESFSFPESEPEKDSDIEMESFSFPEEEPEEDSDIEMVSSSFSEPELEEDFDIEMESFPFPEPEPEKKPQINVKEYIFPKEQAKPSESKTDEFVSEKQKDLENTEQPRQTQKVSEVKIEEFEMPEFKYIDEEEDLSESLQPDKEEFSVPEKETSTSDNTQQNIFLNRQTDSQMRISEVLEEWKSKQQETKAILDAHERQEQIRKEKVKQETAELMKLISGDSNALPKDVQKILKEIDEEKEETKKTEELPEEEPEEEIDEGEVEEISFDDLKTPKTNPLFSGQASKDTSSISMIRELEQSLTSKVSQKAVNAGHLTKEQARLFAYFSSVKGMSEQLAVLFKGNSRAGMKNSSKGNLIITGQPGNGKTTLAIDIVKALQKQSQIGGKKLAKISGKKLNQKDIQEVLSNLKGGALIIEGAGALSDPTLMALSLSMEGDTGGLLMILEDSEDKIQSLLHRNKSFATKFNYTIDIPVFSNDELVAFGKSYALEQDYVFDEFGILALYDKIGNRQTIDHTVNVTEVKEIIDNAIQHAEKGSVRHIFERVTKKNTDQFGNHILREEDF